jgi:hypothetical protein
MNNQRYYSKNYYRFLLDELQRHNDDFNWAIAKYNNLRLQLETTSSYFTNIQSNIRQEMNEVQNQIDSFQKLLTKTQNLIIDYENRHQTQKIKKENKWVRGAK